jgi:putative ABC transport system permease protein
MKLESIKYSLNNLKQRKTRSAFTIISILVGITTIFIFISFGMGLYKYVDEVSSDSSADKIIIQPKGAGAPGMDTTFALTDDDIRAIGKASGVYDVSGIYFKTVEVVQSKKNFYTLMIGYDPKKPLVMDVFGLDMDAGRDLQSGDRNVVAGYNYQIADKIFPKGYSVGERIEIQGQKVKVVGFYEAVGNPQDDAQIYATTDFMDELYPDEEISYGWVIAQVDEANIDKVVENVEKSLRKERGLEEGKEDFFVQSFAEMLETYTNILDMIIGFIVAIALISVLVSGVNTANTMITSVIERKKEIGIMKSIGSRNSNILSIFLFESSFLGFVAGSLGVFLGWLVTLAGGAILENLGYSFLSPAYSIWLFAGLITFATLTGAISGVFPARRASKTNPVDALRYE